MSNLVKHAKRELSAIGFSLAESAEGPDKWIPDAVIELMEVFAKQGHSGSSAPAVIDLFSKLANFQPLSPISGADHEWSEVVEGEMFQNIRNGAVFKTVEDPKPYYLDAIIWRTQRGDTFTGSAELTDGSKVFSRQYCRMPFTAKTFYVDVIETEIAPDDWEFKVKDESHLEAVFAYYDRYLAK